MSPEANEPGSDDEPRAGDAIELHRDVLYDMLSDRRRRCVLRCLRQYDDTMTLADVADEVAVQECDMRLTDIEPETVMEIYLSLYHTHVPKLEEVGIVEYDQEGDFVSATNLDALDPYLDVTTEQ